jgi:molybdenum ABC transporter, periplasmic molybdate-binding protein
MTVHATSRRGHRPEGSGRARALRSLFVLALVGVLIARASETTQADQVELLVSGAISLRESLQEIGAAFERRHPSVKTLFNFGASGVLQQQLERGAPVDVFVSAASAQMDDLQAKDLIVATTRGTLAENSLVLIGPTHPGLDLASFDDLTKPEVKRIALGNPRTVPAGVYAQELLTALRLWDRLQPKLILTENVRQALVYVIRGEVEAAVVYATDARSAGGDVRVVATAPEGSHRPVTYPIAVVKATKQGALPKAFVDLALSDEGRHILELMVSDCRRR